MRERRRGGRAAEAPARRQHSRARDARRQDSGAAGARRAPANPLTAGVVSGVAAFLLYAATTSPDAFFGDVAEYQTMAATGGIAHAGYPAFVLVLRAFGHLPISTFAMRANLVSCLAAALAVGLAGFAAARLVRSAAIGVASALALALSLTLWQDATHASVHSFTLPISAGLFLLGLRFAERPGAGVALLAGLLGGLGLVSHLSVLGLAPVVVASAWIAGRSRRLRASHLGAAAAGLLLGSCRSVTCGRRTGRASR